MTAASLDEGDDGVEQKTLLPCGLTSMVVGSFLLCATIAQRLTTTPSRGKEEDVWWSAPRLIDALLSRDARWREAPVVVVPHPILPRDHVPAGLFLSTVSVDAKVEDEDASMPTSYPPSPREREAALRFEQARRELELAASRELLQIEIRCVREAEDEISLRVARALRRRRVAALLSPRHSARDIEVEGCGLVATARAVTMLFSSTRCAAPVPRRAWVYFEVDVDSAPKDELLEFSVGIAPATTKSPVGMGPYAAAIASLGGILAASHWIPLPTEDDGAFLRRSMFGPGDTVGVLVYQHDWACRVRFAVNGVRLHALTLALPRHRSSRRASLRLYPTLTFRSRHVQARCRFTAADFSARDHIATLLQREPIAKVISGARRRLPAVYAIDGTRILRDAI